MPGRNNGADVLEGKSIDPRKRAPQIGDIVQKSALQHIGILTWIDEAAVAVQAAKRYPNYRGVAVETVEGNRYNGQIVRRKTTLDEWTYTHNGHKTIASFDVE